MKPILSLILFTAALWMVYESGKAYNSGRYGIALMFGVACAGFAYMCETRMERGK